MLKRKISVWLIVILLVTQWSSVFGFNAEAQAQGSAIGEDLITSVTLAVYTDDDYTETVTGSVYQLDSYSELNYTWALPNGHSYTNGSTYTFDLPSQFELYNDLDGPLDFDGETVGTYTVNKNTNKVVFTFNSYIESHDNVGGNFSVRSLLSSKKIKGSTKQTLVFPIKGGTQTIDLDFKPKVTSTVEKKGEPKPQFYNPKSIAWTIDVNKALDSVTGALVTDKLPAGLDLNLNSITVHELNVDVDGKVTPGSQVNSSKFSTVDSVAGELKLAFTDSPITKAYRIGFTTDITSAGIDLTKFVNKAVFSGGGGLSKDSTATVTVGRGKPLDKETTGYDRNNQIISWGINFNYNEKTIPSANAVLDDFFNNSHDLIDSTFKVYPVTIDSSGKATKSSTPLNRPSEYTLTTPLTGPGTNGFKLKFNNDIDSAYRIEYSTQANGRVFDNASVTNNVTYNGETKGDTQNTEQVILHKGYSNVDYANKTVKWTININDDSKTMDDLIVTDTFGNAGLKLDKSSLKVTTKSGAAPSVYSVVYNETEPPAVTDGFVITFTQPVTEPYTITYTTKFNYDWLTSGKDRFSNTAALTWKENGVVKSKDATSTFDPREEVKNNGKKSGSYNAISKKITWGIGANYNQKTLAKAELVDTISAGQIVDLTSVKVFKWDYSENGNPTPGANVSNTDYAVTLVGNTLKVTFKNSIDYAFYVQFDTTFTDQAIDLDKVENNAKLLDGIKAESQNLYASVNIPQGGEYVNKGGVQDGNKINWTIYINRNQSFVKEAEITDVPSDNQILLSNTFNLFKTSVDTNGNITPTNDKLVAGVDYKLIISTDIDGKESFKLSFLKDISEAYVLKYQSLIAAKNNDKVSNKVSFSGKNVKVTVNDSTEEITVKLSSGSGTGSGVRGELKLKKVDKNDGTKVLSGAIFDLYRVVDADQIWIKEGTTDSSGLLVFTKLLGGKYILIEKAAPAGYVLDATPHEATISTTTTVDLTVTNKTIATPTPAPSATPTPTVAPTPTTTVAPTPTPTVTPTPTPVTPATPTPTPVTPATPTPTPVTPATPTPTPVTPATPTPTPVTPATPTPTATPVVPTEGPTATPVPTSPPSSTFEPPATPTPVPGVVVTPTPTPSPGASATATPAVSPTPTAVPTVTPSTTPAVPTVTSTPAIPQATPPVTRETTTEEVPIEGEIPLGGVPSIGDEPAHGKVTLTPNGKWIYTPDPGFIGKDKFTIIVTDKDGNEEEIVIEIAVDEVPKGTVTSDPDGKDKGGKPAVLPKTGEDSPLPIYLAGGSLIILGYVLSRRFRRGNKQE